MPKCPNCGNEYVEPEFCAKCGARLTGLSQVQAGPPDQVGPPDQAAPPDQATPQEHAESNIEDDVRNTVIKRLDGLKNKDESTVRAVMDKSYCKFDDWPPPQRQEAEQALQNEFSAFQVLSNYTYELKDFKANVMGDVALATFTMQYQGNMRNEHFNVISRVSTVLRKENSGWLVVHEHFSRFPEERQPQKQMGRRRFPF